MLSLVIGSICAPIIEKHGSESLKAQWLPGLASGKRRLAFAIPEPDAGTNPHRVTTTARRDGSGWILSGKKYWTSGVDEADAILVVCRSDSHDAGGGDRRPLSLFIVEANAPGISKTPIATALHVPETSFTVFFDDVKLGADALVGEAGQEIGRAHV